MATDAWHPQANGAVRTLTVLRTLTALHTRIALRTRARRVGLPRAECRAFALRRSRERSVRQFARHMGHAPIGRARPITS